MNSHSPIDLCEEGHGVDFPPPLETVSTSRFSYVPPRLNAGPLPLTEATLRRCRKARTNGPSTGNGARSATRAMTSRGLDRSTGPEEDPRARGMGPRAYTSRECTAGEGVVIGHPDTGYTEHTELYRRGGRRGRTP